MGIQRKIFGFIMLASICSGSLSAQQFYEASPLSINTQSKELAPVFYENGLVFCSDRKNEWVISYTDLNGALLTNLYQAEPDKNGELKNPQLFSKDITTRLFEGPATFSRDGNTVYFTRNIDVTPGFRKQKRSDTTFGIFSAERINGTWTNLESFKYNKQDCNTGYPCLSPDGSMMFFCSNDPAGFGGYDIYVAMLENGVWGQPENLGGLVNTPGNEVFPFLHDSNRLYFASRGYNQDANLDIYYSEYMNGLWSSPVALPEPFNSGSDDYGLIMKPGMDTGYFTSDRFGTSDILIVSSTIPTFTECSPQEENNYCYIFYESNTQLDTTAFAYEWDLGDGTRIRSIKAEHCYAEPGTYNVELNVIDKLTNEVYFSEANYRLVVEMIEQPYIAMPDSALTGEQISFSGSESYFKDFEIGGYYWDFGDGNRAVSVEAQHVYKRPGIYEVQLGLTNTVENFDSPLQKQCITRKLVVLEEE